MSSFLNFKDPNVSAYFLLDLLGRSLFLSISIIVIFGSKTCFSYTVMSASFLFIFVDPYFTLSTGLKKKDHIRSPLHKISLLMCGISSPCLLVAYTVHLSTKEHSVYLYFHRLLSSRRTL